jgi:receptor protein-tyrosine kinase
MSPNTTGYYWILGLALGLIGALIGFAVSATATPMYKAHAAMFVSTTGGAPVSNASYQETTASQQMALSLVRLASSQVVTERVVQSLELDMPPAELAEKVEAVVEPETVLINLTVTDSSPTMAREIANATAFEFADFVAELQLKTAPSTPRPTVTLVQPAATPPVPVSPNTFRNTGLGALAGLAIGLVLANLRRRTNRSVRDAGQLGSITGRPPLGSIPRSRNRSKDPVEIVTGDDFVMEGFREVRTNLTHALKDSPSGIISVTSAGLGEGKTTALVGLAITLSDAGHRVAVVDADLRGADLTERLGMAGAVGLADALAGTCGLDDIVVAPNSLRLDVIPAGQPSRHPSELLSADAAEKIFLQLSKLYDFVLVDTPALLAFTDAALAASYSDAVVIVARYGDVAENDLGSAVEGLGKVGANIVGGVFTFAPVPDLLRRSVKAHDQRT